MEFYDVVKRRRSVRKFSPCEVSDEVLLRVIEAGRLAPSGCNAQNRDFIIIRDRRVLAQLHEKTQPSFETAAAAIAVVMDPAPTRYGSYWVEDAAAAIENMLLAIVDEGYDSVWIEGTLLPHEEWAKELLGVPKERRLYALLPVGKAAKEGQGPAKRPLAEIVHFETYGRKR
ncbi:MAG TPA: nitroreductase family protein [Sumerlaeia bacterium]|nr:nitroreductase family protein [Sumerlaeia bacterium]